MPWSNRWRKAVRLPPSRPENYILRATYALTLARADKLEEAREARWANAGRFAAKRPLIAPSRPSSSRLSHLKKSLWRRKEGCGRAHDRAPGVSAPPFLQDLRLCGLHFPRTGLIAPLKGRSKKSDTHSYIQLLKINRGVMLSTTPPCQKPVICPPSKSPQLLHSHTYSPSPKSVTGRGRSLLPIVRLCGLISSDTAALLGGGSWRGSFAILWARRG